MAAGASQSQTVELIVQDDTVPDVINQAQVGPLDEKGSVQTQVDTPTGKPQLEKRVAAIDGQPITSGKGLPLVPGQQVTYALKLSNPTGAALTNIQLVDQLPKSWFSAVSVAQEGQVEETKDDFKVSRQVDIPAGQEVLTWIIATLRADIPSNVTQIPNQAILNPTDTQPDGDGYSCDPYREDSQSSDRESCVTLVELDHPRELSLSKTQVDKQGKPVDLIIDNSKDSVVYYRVTVKNNGQNTVDDAVIYDQMGSDLSLVNGPPGFVQDPQTGMIHNTEPITLAPQEEQSFTFAMHYSGELVGELVHNAAVVTTTADDKCADGEDGTCAFDDSTPVFDPETPEKWSCTQQHRVKEDRCAVAESKTPFGGIRTPFELQKGINADRGSTALEGLLAGQDGEAEDTYYRFTFTPTEGLDLAKMRAAGTRMFLDDLLPEGMRLMGSRSADGLEFTCEPIDNTITKDGREMVRCSIQTPLDHEPRTLDMYVAIDTQAPLGSVANTAVLNLEGDPNALNLEDCLNLTEGGAPIDPRCAVSHNDVSKINQLLVRKQADQRTIGLGESVLYTIRIRHQEADGPGAEDVVVYDQLPLGFKLISKTIKVRTPSGRVLKLKPEQRGRSFSVRLPQEEILYYGDELELTYRARPGVVATRGNGVNTAWARARGFRSNRARFKVDVYDFAFSRYSMVVGKVFLDRNGDGFFDEADDLGIPGAKVYLSDGRYAYTDRNGTFHFDRLHARSMVAKVDTYAFGEPLYSCLLDARHGGFAITTQRNLGDPRSRWLDLKSGELHRADFALFGCQDALFRWIEQKRQERDRQAPPHVDHQLEGQP